MQSTSMIEVAPDILPNPEQSEPLSLVSIDDVVDYEHCETPVTPEIIEPKADMQSLHLGSVSDVTEDDTPVTPERIEPKSASKKSNSIGDKSTSNKRPEVRARYLDTSSGSCHEFCKYGHKNVKETTSSFIAKQRKKLAENPKPLSEPKGDKVNQTRVPKNKINRVAKIAPSPENPMSKRTSSISSTTDRSDKIPNDVILSKGKKKELVPQKAPSIPKPLIRREPKGKSQIVKDPKEVSHLKRLSASVGKVEKRHSLDENTSEEKLGGDGNEVQHDGKMCFENKKGKQKSPGAIATKSSLISRNKNLELKKDQTALSKSIKRVDGVSSSIRSSTKTKKQMPKEKVELVSWPKRVSKKAGLEETIDSAHKLAFKSGKVLDVKPNNTVPRRLKFKPRKVVSEDLNSKANDVSSSKTEVVKQMTNPKMGTNTRVKRVGKVGVEEKSEKSPHKLDFERGKNVDVQPKNTAPRRLKFKPRKVIVENINGDTGRRNLKKYFGVDDGKGTANEHLRVVLKHQNVEGKKDVQSLLNNVIEETATRLVRLRKSKVKALVGAFESLMSLPDAKSSTTSAS